MTAGNLTVNYLNIRNGTGRGIDSGPGTDTSLPNIKVTGGTFADNVGGALNSSYTGGTLRVTGATFAGNIGGGINNGAAATVIDSTFRANTGGGINNSADQISSYKPLLKVIGATFTGNSGGGINTDQGTTTIVSNCSFIRNSGSGIQAQGDVKVTDSAFTRNAAFQGGGIDNDGVLYGQVTATRDTFTGNTATAGGGGIYNFDGTTVTNDTFTGNTAPVGGGMENEWITKVINSTFLQNKASLDGGGFYNDDTATIIGSTFDQNKAATDGGAIYQEFAPYNQGQGTPSLSVMRSRIAGNSAGGAGGGVVNEGGSVTLTRTGVTGNHPGNCAPANSVSGCTG